MDKPSEIADIRRPRFSFFNIQLSKNRSNKRQISGFPLLASAVRVSLARLSLDKNKGELLCASGAPPSLVSAL